MTDEKVRKTEAPLKLDMSFSEALRRLMSTDPKEVAESIDRSKTKKPAQGDPPRRPRQSVKGRS